MSSPAAGQNWGTRRWRHGKVGTTHKDKVIRFQQVCASLDSHIVSWGDTLAQVIGQRSNESVMHIRPQGWMFKVWVHAWERGLHISNLRFIALCIDASLMLPMCKSGTDAHIHSSISSSSRASSRPSSAQSHA